jgi:rhodanese-related sulfurtransferase
MLRMPEVIQRDRVKELRASGASILEVLPREEFDREHIAGAVSLPLDELRASTAEHLLGPNKQQPVVVYCQDVQ